MATPVNTQYQLELYQEFERNLPQTWFKRLRNQDGPLYPLVWGLCGALAGVQEAIESAIEQSIPASSEGFWLSLHLLGLGLVRRSSESNEQALQRYQFEFTPTRNTREGLLRALVAYSGLEPPEIRLETNFAKGLLGELTLVIETQESWATIDWWWLRPYLEEWVANGLARRTNINTQGLETIGFRPWDFYTRFPTGPDLLKPFWERPAFLSELRIFEFERQFEARTRVSGFVGGWVLGLANGYTLPAASGYTLPIAITPLVLVPAALIDTPISRNILGFVCVGTWESYSLRITEIWRNIASAYRRGQPFIYMGDSSDCQRLIIDTLTLPPKPFPDSSIFDMLGYGPWRLRIGQGADLAATAIAEPVDELILAGQWWLNAAGTVRRSTPELFLDGSVRWQLEFMMAKRDEPFYLRELELTLGYEQPSFGVTLGPWSVPGAGDWVVPPNFSLLTGNNFPEDLTLALPSLARVHYRRVDAWIPPNVNLGLLLDLRTESTILLFEGDPLLFGDNPMFYAG